MLWNHVLDGTGRTPLGIRRYRTLFLWPPCLEWLLEFWHHQLKTCTKHQQQVVLKLLQIRIHRWKKFPQKMNFNLLDLGGLGYQIADFCPYLGNKHHVTSLDLDFLDFHAYHEKSDVLEKHSFGGMIQLCVQHYHIQGRPCP